MPTLPTLLGGTLTQTDERRLQTALELQEIVGRWPDLRQWEGLSLVPYWTQLAHHSLA